MQSKSSFCAVLPELMFQPFIAIRNVRYFKITYKVAYITRSAVYVKPKWDGCICHSVFVKPLMNAPVFRSEYVDEHSHMADQYKRL